jgi:NADPH2:quinone reductase
MKAIQIHQAGSFNRLKYEDIETPSAGAGQVLVKVVSASVNFADVMIRRGTYPMMPPLPAIPGVDCSGVVEAVGNGVSQFLPGQHVVVLGQGCYADYVVANAGAVMTISDEIDMDEAAAIPVNYLTAYHMLHTMARVRPEERVLVYAAAGGVGTATAQLAKPAGVTCIGLTSSDEKARYAKEQGMAHVINYKSEDVSVRVMEITGGQGANLILNSAAGDTFGRDFELLAPLGQIVWFGMAAGPPEVNFTELLGAGFGKSAGIRTFVLYSIYDLDPQLTAESFVLLFDYLAKGLIKPHIHERLPLSEAARAHELLESGAVKGKLILKP